MRFKVALALILVAAVLPSFVALFAQDVVRLSLQAVGSLVGAPNG